MESNSKRHKRPSRACLGCGLDISDGHGLRIFCSTACRSWVRQGHTDLRTLPTACRQCGRSMSHKRAGAVYCSKTCKVRASDQRRNRSDAHRYQQEKERRLAYAKAYAKANPHVGQAARRRRKAIKARADAARFNGADWLNMCRRHDHKCFYCGERKPLTQDHIIPIIRGGRHAEGNIVPACISCNASKSARLIIEWRTRSH